MLRPAPKPPRAKRQRAKSAWGLSPREKIDPAPRVCWQLTSVSTGHAPPRKVKGCFAELESPPRFWRTHFLYMSSRWDPLLGSMLVHNQLIIQGDGLGGLKALGLPILIGFAQPWSPSCRRDSCTCTRHMKDQLHIWPVQNLLGSHQRPSLKVKTLNASYGRSESGHE